MRKAKGLGVWGLGGSELWGSRASGLLWVPLKGSLKGDTIRVL